MIPLAVRLLFPGALVVGAALTVKGYAYIGDGFSGGATAGLGALLLYTGLDHDDASRAAGARAAWTLVVLGLLLALAVALSPVAAGNPPVFHLPRPGSDVVRLGVLELHTALVFDAGVALVVYGALVGTFDRLFPHLTEQREERR